MAIRAEYLAGSLSRRQPWLAEGIVRRTWERRRRKIIAGETPITRSEYLARSLAKRQPWLSEGVCRRTWERRRRNIALEAKAYLFRVESTDRNAPRQTAALRTGRRADEELIMHLVHAHWDAKGLSHSGRRALSSALYSIRLPKRLKSLTGRALALFYRRARARLPLEYDRWIELVQKWDPSFERRGARELIDRLIVAIGDRSPTILSRLFDHLEQQISDHWPKKVRRLERECAGFEKNNHYWPQLRTLKQDKIKEEVYASLVSGPKAPTEIASRFGKTRGAISSIGRRLRNEGRIKTVFRNGQFMWAQSSTAGSFIPARDAIIAALKKGPMTIPTLAREIDKGESTVKSALHKSLLAKGVVIRTKFGTYALAGTEALYVSRSDAIVAALNNGPKSFQEIAREIGITLPSLPQFLERLLEKRKIIRTKHGVYALPGSAPVYVPTSDAIITALAKKRMKSGPLVRHVNKLTKSNRSRGTITAVLLTLKKRGTVEQEKPYGEYRLVRSVQGGRAARRMVARKAQR